MDEFLTPVSRIERLRLTSAVNHLKKTPDLRLYIIEYFSDKESEAVIREKVRRTTAFLMDELKLAQTNFEIITDAAANQKPRTKLYIGSPGLPPAP